MLLKRRKSRQVRVGKLKIGGSTPISIQSMCTTPTSDIKKTTAQISALEEAGCDIARVAVPDMKSASALGEIKKEINIPLVADIHFDYRLAVESAKHADKLRINPGNIGGRDKIKQVIRAAKDNSIPIRIGVNTGSIEKKLLEKYGPTPQAMVQSALNSIKFMEELDFSDIVLSLKASDVQKTVEAYRLIADKTDCPLHVGITEAGTIFSGTIKSSVGIGALLLQGIGDTIRVSLAADPVEEVKVGIEILKSLGLKSGPNIIACPTCARSNIDVISIAGRVQDMTKDIKKQINIAVMGCEVNGPGEARHADIGIAGGKDCAVLFIKGRIIRKGEPQEIVKELVKQARSLR